VILDPLETAGAANKEKFSRGSAKANEFEIGIQHMGTTQKVLYTLINLFFWEKQNFFANKVNSYQAKEKCLFFP
jgi:hypothetical protein